MAFYFSSDTNAFYDTDVFPEASLPTNKYALQEEEYHALLSRQNNGYVILYNSNGEPYVVQQGESTATDIKHAASVATTVALGHVKIGNTMTAANDGTINVKEGAIASSHIADGSITTQKIADASVSTAKIENGSVTEEKLEATKNLIADESSLTMTEGANNFTLSVKDGGISRAKIADAAINSSKLDEYAVESVNIKPGAVISSKIAGGAVGTNALADGSVTHDKLASESVNLSNIVSDFRPRILSFVDSNANDLNGTEWVHTFLSQDDKPNIGLIPNTRIGSLCDFTFEAQFYIPQDDITTDIEFDIVVLCIQNEINYVYDRRTVKVTAGCSFVRERFSFLTARTTEVRVNFETVTNISRAGLKNMQLRGFGIM